jgi:8-oxo-dGTP diphosphatase
MSNTSLEKIGCFNTILDPYNGITIESKDLPIDTQIFETNLDFLINSVKNKRNKFFIALNFHQSYAVINSKKLIQIKIPNFSYICNMFLE